MFCEKHPGRVVEVCGEEICAGCFEATLFEGRLIPGRKEPWVEPKREHEGGTGLTPEQIVAFREVILSNIKEFTVEEQAGFEAHMRGGR